MEIGILDLTWSAREGENVSTASLLWWCSMGGLGERVFKTLETRLYMARKEFSSMEMDDQTSASDDDLVLKEEEDNEVEGREATNLVFKATYEAKLRELLHKINSFEIKLCSDATKEFVKLLKGNSGGELLRLYVQSTSNFSELVGALKLREGKPGMSYILSLISVILSHPDGKYKPNDKERIAISVVLDKFARSFIEEKFEVVYKELNSKEGKCQNAALLLMASIVRRGSGLLRWILQQREIFSGVLRGLENDDNETVIFVLSTLRDKILTEQSLVSPALRSVLFGSVVLEQLVGISGMRNGPSAELAHNVLLMVCTDPCNGLMPDFKRCPTPLRGNPKRLLVLMKKLKATEIDNHRDLLLAIVRGSLSFGSAYMEEFPYNLEDYASPSWFSSVSLAANLVSSMAVGDPFGFIDFQSNDPPCCNSVHVQNVMTIISSRPLSRSVINKGLLHLDFLVKNGTLRLLLEALKLLDSFLRATSLSCTRKQKIRKGAVLKQEIWNEIRTLLPDPQVLLTLLSPLSGINSLPDIALAEDDENVVESQIPHASDGTMDFMNVISELWGSDLCSVPDTTLKDAEIFFQSKLLDALKIYLLIMPTALEGSFDFFMNLHNNPSELPFNILYSLLPLLVEYIRWSPGSEITVRTPPLMYKHLQPFLNLLIFSPSGGIKAQAYKLTQAAMSNVSPEFSPLVICVLQKCMRLLSSESGTFSLLEKSMISVYVCNTLKYLLQTQVDARLLAALIRSVLSEGLQDQCSVEWQPLKNLLLFSDSILHQKAFCFFLIDEKDVPVDSSFVRALGEVRKIIESGHSGEIAVIMKDFFSAIMCTTSDGLLMNFPTVMTISQHLHIPLPFLSSVFFHKQNFLAGVLKLWPQVFFPGLEKAVSMIDPQGVNDDVFAQETILDVDFDASEFAAAVAFGLFLRQAPFHVLFPAIISTDGPCLSESSKIKDNLANDDFSEGNSRDNLQAFLSFSQQRIHPIDHHVLDMLTTTFDYLLSSFTGKHCLLKVEDGVSKQLVKAFKIPIQKIYLKLKDKFDLCIRTEDYLPLLLPFYALHALMQFTSPFELFDLVLWIFDRFELNGLTNQKSSACNSKSTVLYLWEMEKKILDINLIEEIYFKICKFATNLKVDFAYSCLLEAVSAVYRQKYMQCDLLDALSLENYDEFLPSSIEELVNLVDASLLGKAIKMLQCHFAFSGGMKMKERLKMFSSILTCSDAHDQLLDCDVDETEFYSLSQSLNLINRVVAKISLCRMMLFPVDNHILSPKEADGNSKLISLDRLSNKEGQSRMLFIKILVSTWQCLVKKFPSVSNGSRGEKSSGCLQLFRYLELFLRTVLELTTEMRGDLVHLQAIPFLEQLMRSSLLFRFEDPTTLDVLRNGALFKPMPSILRSLDITHPKQNDLQTTKPHLKQLEIVKLLRTLIQLKPELSGGSSGKESGINLKELHLLLLSSYGATLSEIDLEIYNLMQEIESIDKSVSEDLSEMDYLWGSAALKIRNERALDQDLSSNIMTDNRSI
ncbi:hypothetical protein GH714_039771 [Hevea brasiliensis]|uniref:URB1 N-terminal domain-containing protein n=1 Tax=Hevea brasiliensis TaxID=3981 RepID=A0A6A6KET2_HEVBR|nr:hypothetical protein GH714_039771 [Hevea brasiliensis]